MSASSAITEREVDPWGIKKSGPQEAVKGAVEGVKARSKGKKGAGAKAAEERQKKNQ
jgi:hypothetical protein